MNAALAFSALCVIFTFAWLVTFRHRSPRRASELLLDAKVEIANSIYPMVSNGRCSRIYTDSDLWDAVGGVGGLIKIGRSAGSLATVARYFALECPECAPDLRAAWWDSVCVRFMVPLCLIEACLCRAFPLWRRPLSWGIARLYCDMASSVEIILSTYNAIPSARI